MDLGIFELDYLQSNIIVNEKKNQLWSYLIVLLH